MEKRIRTGPAEYCDMGQNAGKFRIYLQATLYLTGEELEKYNNGDFDIVITGKAE